MSKNGREPLYVVRNSEIHGRGVFALRRIRKGTRILEYTGERISNKEADRRYDDDNMKRHHTFLFTLDSKTCIDGSIKTGGGDASFINHSCEPNCEAVIYGSEVWIEAARTIEPGEELCYDYKYERDGEADESWEQLYLCRCGAPGCRGTILLPETRKRRKPRKRPRGETSRRRRS